MSASSPFIVPNRINGIDLCPTIQVNVDFKKVKDHGFEFVYIKSSQYSKTSVGAFSKYLDRARDAGLRVGAYHFCSHDTEPEAQAQFFFRASGGLGSKSGELPPMVDWEFCTPSNYKPHPFHCVNWAERFMKTATELWYPDNENRIIKRLPTLYTYPNYAKTHQPSLQASVLGIYPLCYASYASKPDGKGGFKLIPWLPNESQEALHKVPMPWAGNRLWQYSGNNGLPVPGISGDCDRQLFNGSSGDWAEFLGLQRPVHQTVKEVVEK